MGLSQIIYTSVLITELSAKNAYDTSALSVNVCKQYGITGRVFANRQQALAITEGPTEIVDHYFKAVQSDPLAGKILLHLKREIEVREFEDYSVWLNLGQDFQSTASLRQLTPETLAFAWPSDLSAKIRIMADAYLDHDMLKAG